jgi:hypothetical protein
MVNLVFEPLVRTGSNLLDIFGGGAFFVAAAWFVCLFAALMEYDCQMRLAVWE